MQLSFKETCHLACEGGEIFHVENERSEGGMRDFLTCKEILQLQEMDLIKKSISQILFPPKPKLIQIVNNGAIVKFTPTIREKRDLNISKWTMTSVGRELAQLVDDKPNIQYLRAFKSYMAERGYDIEVILPAGDGLGRVIV